MATKTYSGIGMQVRIKCEANIDFSRVLNARIVDSYYDDEDADGNGGKHELRYCDEVYYLVDYKFYPSRTDAKVTPMSAREAHKWLEENKDILNA